MRQHLYCVVNSKGLFRLGKNVMSGVYGKLGKLWTGLNYIKSHYKGCCVYQYVDIAPDEPNLVYTQKYKKTYFKQIPDDIPDDDVIIEYELVEVRRFPAKELFKEKT